MYIFLEHVLLLREVMGVVPGCTLLVGKVSGK